MKRILVLVVAITLSLGFHTSYSADCNFDGDSSQAIQNLVDGCMDGTMVIDDQNKDLNSWSWTNELINSLIQWLWVILAIWAIAMLVYSWFLMTISAGDDEKVKKWKELFKWTIIWFIALVSAWWLVSLLISFIFDFAGI